MKYNQAKIKASLKNAPMFWSYFGADGPGNALQADKTMNFTRNHDISAQTLDASTKTLDRILGHSTGINPKPQYLTTSH